MNKSSSGLGKGALYLMVVQTVFLASGYIIHAGLGRILGPSLYGTFGVVIAIVTVFDLILISGLPQAASRYIAMNDENAGAVKRAANRLTLYLSTAVFLSYLLLADIIAYILGDPELAFYLRISAFIIPVYAFYALYGGFLNGLRAYGKQAMAIFFYNVGKVMGVFALVLLGFSVGGAIAGFAIAPLVGFLVARHYFKLDGTENEFEGGELLRFAAPVIIFSVAFAALMSIDLFFVKRILADNVQVGYYTAAYNLARIPFYILTALGAALYPAVSKSIAVNDGKQTRDYIVQSLRYLLILLAPIVALLHATSGILVDLFYSSVYLPASPPLKILVFGLACYTLFHIFATVITACGKPAIAMLLSLSLIPIAMLFNIALIPAYGLSGAALATTIVSLFGMCLAAVYVFKLFKAIIDARSFLKICVASVIIYILALQPSIQPVFLPLLYLLLFALYFCILFLIKELSKEDLETFKRVIPYDFSYR